MSFMDAQRKTKCMMRLFSNKQTFNYLLWERFRERKEV